MPETARPVLSIIEHWPEVLTALVSLSLGVLAYLSAARARRVTDQIERIKVDAAAYERAQHIYDSAIEHLSAENARLIGVVAKLEHKVELLEDEVAELRYRVRDRSQQ